MEITVRVRITVDTNSEFILAALQEAEDAVYLLLGSKDGVEYLVTSVEESKNIKV